MPHRFTVLLLSALLLATLRGFSQQGSNFLFTHLSQSDGLLHNNVLSVTQDGKGFIWVATQNGLQRYDGSRFTTYPEMLNNPDDGLTYNAEMFADKTNNTVWISNNSGIERLDLARNRFSLYNQQQLLNDAAYHYTVYRTPDQHRYLLDHNVIFEIDSATNKPVLFRFNFLPPNNAQASFVATDTLGQRTWAVIGADKILMFDKRTGMGHVSPEATPAHPLLDKRSFKNDGIGFRFIMIDSRQNIWLSTWGDDLYRYDALLNKVFTYSLRALSPTVRPQGIDILIPLVNTMLEDDHHHVWIGTENRGLLSYDLESDEFTRLLSTESPSQGLDYYTKVYSLFQDKDQNIWVGTDKGISIFNPYRQYFTSIRHSDENPNTIEKGEILNVIQVSNGDLYIGSWGGGMAIYDSRGNFKKNVHFPGATEQNFIWSFSQFNENELWLGCQAGFLIKYNMATGAYTSSQPEVFASSTIRWMQKDQWDNTWFGVQNGKIMRWDKAMNRFIFSGYPRGKPSRGNVLNMLIDHEHRFWVSTSNGFKEFDPVRMVYKTEWTPDGNHSAGLSGKTCQGIEEYNDSTLLIATNYGGLNVFNKRSGRFTTLGVKDGLPSNTIYAVKKGNEGYVWITTDYGLYQYHPILKKLVPYRLEKGVITSSFFSTVFLPLRSGQWLTHSIAEAVIFDPLQLAIPEKLPRVEVTGFRVYERPIEIDSLLFRGAAMELGYRDNFITIEFAALNFSSLHEHNFEYKLAGVDKDWVNGKGNRFASYTDLKPGEYLFQVRAGNGISTGEVSTFRIIIHPPFWKTWWFMAIVGLLLLLAIFGLIKWRESNLKAIQAEKLKLQETQIQIYSMNEQLSKAKLEALRSQMNPHFIFNCINSIDALIQSNDKYHATVYLNKFAKLIRNVLDSSKQNVVLLSKDLDTLRLYIELEQLRHENKFTAEVKAEEQLLMDDFKVPPLIVQPFVENAILHGLRYRPDNNGKLFISVERKGDLLRYLIEDNGVGRMAVNNPAQKENVSYGIDMSNDRVKLFNGEDSASVQITDLFKNDQPAGTRVEVYLKLQ